MCKTSWIQSVAATVLVLIAGAAYGDLVLTGCFENPEGGAEIKGPEKPGQRVEVGTVTDKAGTKFVMEIVNNIYFEGKVVRGGKDIPFGRCKFQAGLNDQSFEYDQKTNNFLGVVRLQMQHL